MKKTLSSSVLFICLFLTQVVFAQEGKNYEVGHFDKIEISVRADVYYTQGENKLVINGSDDVLSRLDVSTENGELEIEYKNKWGSKNHDRITIYVSSSKIRAIELAGSVNFYAKENVSANSLDIDLAGSGKIEMNKLTATKIDLDMAGSCKAFLAGPSQVNTVDLDMAGSCRIDALGLQTVDLDVDIAGSGSAKVFCTGTIDADIAGSGDIRYKGNPRYNTSVSGSGRVRPIGE